MKPRARRIALLTVAAGCLVVLALLTLHAGTLRERIAAWRLGVEPNEIRMYEKQRKEANRHLQRRAADQRARDPRRLQAAAVEMARKASQTGSE